jgi:tetratricopeptide (TPR) repeat protein
MIYKEVLAEDPDFRDAWYEMGTVQQSLKRYDDALASFNKAISIRDNLSWLQYDKGILLIRMGKSQEAAAALTRAIELNSKNSWAQLELANLHFRAGRWVHAAKHYQEALKLNPSAPSAKQNLEICQSKMEAN